MYFVNGAQRRSLVDENAHCSPLLFSLGRRRGVLTVIHDIFSFILWVPISAAASNGDLPVSVFFSVSPTYIMHFFVDLGRFKPSFGLAHTAAEDSSDHCLYDVATPG